MFNVSVDDNENYTAAITEAGAAQLNGEPFDWEIIGQQDEIFFIRKDNSIYEAEIIKHDKAEKLFIIRVNGNDYSVKVKDRFDVLLEQLGMSSKVHHKVNEIKAPMPGLVLSINVTEGQELKKDEPVLILEAMKMENIIKSPGEGKVKKIEVKQGQAVEKNQLLLTLE